MATQRTAPKSHPEYDLLCEVLPQPIVQAVELCALPHSLDDALGYEVIHNFSNNNGATRAVWAEVKRLPFIYPNEGGSWRFAESARDYFVARLEQRNGTFLALHKYLKEHLEDSRQQVQDVNSPQARELDWRITYHLAAVDAQAAIERLFEIGEQAARANRLADMRGVVDLFQEQQQWLSSYQVEYAYSEGRYAYSKDDFSTAERRFEFVWKHGHPDQAKAIAGHLLGTIWMKQQERDWLHQAENIFRESLELGVQLQDSRTEAIVLTSLGGVLVRLGGRKRLEEAEKSYRRSLEIENQFNNPRGEAIVLNSLGGVLVKLGRRERFEEAELLFRRSLELRVQLNNPRDEAMVLNSLGSVLVKLGGRKRLEEAEKFYRRSLELGVQLQDSHHKAMVLNSLGSVLVKLGGRKRLEEAEKSYRRSLKILRKISDRRGEAMVLTNFASLAEAEGDIPLACQRMEQVLKINEALGYSRNVQMSRKRLEKLRSKLSK